MAHDTITLIVPASPEYAKTVRMTASALVSRTRLSYDEVDDVRIAAEEVFVYAADHAGEGGEVRMEFVKAAGHFEIRVRLGNGGRVASEEVERRAAYATFILQSVCDRFEMSSDETGTYLKVVKNLPPGSHYADD